jgi:hypothetical protein
MQAKTKCSSEAPQLSQSQQSQRSTRSGPAAPTCPASPSQSTSRGGYRLPGSAFSESFLEKLRLAVRRLDGDEAEEAEAALAGPLAVERVRTRGGAAWAVVRSAEPVAAGGRAAAVARDRSEALRLAAVLPAVPAESPYHLGDRPKRMGYALHLGRRHVAHVSRLAKVEDAKTAAKKGWTRRRALVSHLQLARYFAANPEALALLIESVGPEALPRSILTRGRALARRVEAVLKEAGG